MKKILIISCLILFCSCVFKQNKSSMNILFTGKIKSKAHPVYPDSKIPYMKVVYSKITISNRNQQFYEFETDSNGVFEKK